MSLEMEQRIAKLEKEMMDLRQELDVLKQQHSAGQSTAINARKTIIKQSSPLAEQKPNSTSKPNPRPIPEKKKQPQQSLEERIMWALPKIFMVILVMGVLWGLKLVSDYGYLSNEVKIILAYVLSIFLAVLANVLEHRKKRISSYHHFLIWWGIYRRNFNNSGQCNIV